MMTSRPNPLYARLWIRIASSSPDRDFEVLGLQNDVDEINIGLMRNTQQLAINAPVIASIRGTTRPAVLDADRWMCFQLRVVFDSGGNGAIQLSVDNTLSIDLTNVTTDLTTPLSIFRFGVVSGMGEPGTYDVDYDDVVIAGAPIPCT